MTLKQICICFLGPKAKPEAFAYMQHIFFESSPLGETTSKQSLSDKELMNISSHISVIIRSVLRVISV